MSEDKVSSASEKPVSQGENTAGVCSVADIPDEELLRRAVAGARIGRSYNPRWYCVAHVFGLGSTYSAQLCRRFKLDPEERVRHR